MEEVLKKRGITTFHIYTAEVESMVSLGFVLFLSSFYFLLPHSLFLETEYPDGTGGERKAGFL